MSDRTLAVEVWPSTEKLADGLGGRRGSANLGRLVSVGSDPAPINQFIPLSLGQVLESGPHLQAVGAMDSS